MGPMSKQSPSLFLSSSFSYIFPRGRSHIASSIREKGFHKIQILSRSRSPPTGHDVKGMGSVETELCPAGLCSGPEGHGPGSLQECVHVLSQTSMSLFTAFLLRPAASIRLSYHSATFSFLPQSIHFSRRDSRQQVCP